jgi:methionyl-tRNA formyltransferase
MSNTRIVFFGTPRFAVTILDELKNAGIVPSLIVTAPDRPAGRGLVLTPPPVKDWALLNNLDFVQPSKLSTLNSELDVVLNSEWDLFIVAAYGKILPQSVLDVPAHGTLNVHPSLLPKFRGASPIESQILADERTVGVSIMELDHEMDHGPILAQASITLDQWPVRARDLEELLATEGGALLAESIPPYMSGELVPTAQDHELATFTKKIEKADGELDLTADGYQNYLKYCAYDEWPGSFFFQDGKRIKIVSAELRSGQFVPMRVVPEGKPERDYLPPAPGR